MHIPSIFRLLRSNLSLPTHLPPRQRLSPPSRPLLYSMASAPSRLWPPSLARRDAPVMEASNQAARRVSRSPHGYRHMASSNGVSNEFEHQRGHLVLSANDPIHGTSDILTSLGEQFVSTEDMENVENMGRDSRANAEEDGMRASTNIVWTTMEGTDGRRDTKGVILEVHDKQDARETECAVCRDDCHSDSEEDTRGANKLSDGEEYGSWTDEDGCPDDLVTPMIILEHSSHRDGSIYKGTRAWQQDYRIADRNETRIEAMTLSNPTEACPPEDCYIHTPCRMLQIFSVKLAKIPMSSNLVELYGYIAMRDCLDPSPNYVINLGRGESIIMEQGSLIEMVGPKRGIEMYGTVLIEYDMRIKSGQHEKDDLQLIDGVSLYDDTSYLPCHASTKRIHGDCGAVDITASLLDGAVEATVEVFISEVQSKFDLCVGCFTSGIHEEIRLFDGVICEPRALRRAVVAVVSNRWLQLKFKVGSDVVCCSFEAVAHGCSSQEMKIEFAAILVKVTWSTLSF